MSVWDRFKGPTPLSEALKKGFDVVSEVEEPVRKCFGCDGVLDGPCINCNPIAALCYRLDRIHRTSVKQHAETMKAMKFIARVVDNIDDNV